MVCRGQLLAVVLAEETHLSGIARYRKLPGQLLNDRRLDLLRISFS